jgi:hypothetical protein
MPSSHPRQLNEILDLILQTDPQKLLDIGIGFGKYGFLAREYLEMWNSNNEYLHWTRQIDGIEAFQVYITPVHEKIYNTIYRGDALQILPTIQEKYDLILMIDVLEHFTFEEGLQVLANCLEKGRNLLISVPKVMSEQGEVFGNPYETHKYNWRSGDFKNFPNRFILTNAKSTICFIGADARRIKNNLKKKRMHDFLVTMLTALGIKEYVRSLLKR